MISLKKEINPIHSIYLYILLYSTNLVSTITLQPKNSKWYNNNTYYFIDNKDIKSLKPIVNINKYIPSSTILIDESYWIEQRSNLNISSLVLNKEDIELSIKEYESAKYYTNNNNSNICTIPHLWSQSYQNHTNLQLPDQSFVAFKLWLDEWKSFYEKERKKENDNYNDDDEYILEEIPSKIFYIYGPISTYKTVTITNIAKSLDYEILTYGSDCCRSRDKLMKEVKEAVQCKSIFSMKKSKKNNKQKSSPKTHKLKKKSEEKEQSKSIIKNKNTKPKLILFEDCDFSCDIDNGYFSSLQNIINDTLCPLIFTSNNMCDFINKNANSVLHSYKYNDDIIYEYIKKMMKLHNVDISENLFHLLYDYYEKDIRKLLSNLQLWMNNIINENVLWNCVLGYNPLSINNTNHLIHLAINSFDKIERFETLTRNYYNSFANNSKEENNKSKKYQNYEITNISPENLYCMNNEILNICGNNFDNKIKAILLDDYQVTDFIIKDSNNIEITLKPESLQCCRYYHINFLLSDGSLFPQYPNSYHNIFFVIHSCEDEKEIIQERREDFEDKIEEFESVEEVEKLHIIPIPLYHFNIRNNNKLINNDKELDNICKISDILSVINTFEYEEIRDNKMKEYEEYVYGKLLNENINNYINSSLIPQYISTRTKLHTLEKVNNSYIELNNLFTNRNEKVDYISSFRAISYITKHDHCSYHDDALLDYDLTNENSEFLSNQYSQFVK